MIGKKVRVFWPVDSSWYTGTVQQYDSNSGEHLLKYQDGDTEWVKIGENNTTGNAQDTSPPTASTTEDSKPSGDSTIAQSSEQRPGGKKWEGGPVYPPYFGPSAPPYGPGATMPPPYGGMPGMMPGPYGGMMYPPYGGGAPPMYGYPGHKPPESEAKESSYSRRKSGPKAWSKAEDEMLLNIVHSMQVRRKSGV